LTTFDPKGKLGQVERACVAAGTSGKLGTPIVAVVDYIEDIDDIEEDEEEEETSGEGGGGEDGDDVEAGEIGYESDSDDGTTTRRHRQRKARRQRRRQQPRRRRRNRLRMFAPQVLPSSYSACFLEDSGTARFCRLTNRVVAGHSGVSSDGRVLLQRAQQICLAHRYAFGMSDTADEEDEEEGEEISLALLLEELSLYMQEYTSKPAARPFGACLVVGYVPKSSNATTAEPPSLYRVDPSGNVERIPFVVASTTTTGGKQRTTTGSVAAAATAVAVVNGDVLSRRTDLLPKLLSLVANGGRGTDEEATTATTASEPRNDRGDGDDDGDRLLESNIARAVRDALLQLRSQPLRSAKASMTDTAKSSAVGVADDDAVVRPPTTASSSPGTTTTTTTTIDAVLCASLSGDGRFRTRRYGGEDWDDDDNDSGAE